MNPEQHILCLAARTCLDADAERRLLALLQGPVNWDRLWAQGHLHEVLPLVHTSLQHYQRQVPIPDEWMARARRRAFATLTRNITLVEELLGALAALEAAGIAAIPVKGVVLAETLYENLALRPAADVDVLVRPDDLPRARAVLRARGFGHRAAPLFAEVYHPYHDPQYFRATAGGEVCLELHWALWAPRFFRLSTAALWERAVPARLRGTAVRILSPEDTLLHLAIHRSRSALRLRFVCDIAELLRRHGATLDWDYVLRQTRAAGARTALYFALALPWRLLDAPLPEGILARLGVSRVKRRLLENTCGVTALFRSAAADDLTQQPHLTLRILEQDGIIQIARAFGYSLFRTGKKYLYNYRQARRLEIRD